MSAFYNESTGQWEEEKGTTTTYYNQYQPPQSFMNSHLSAPTVPFASFPRQQENAEFLPSLSMGGQSEKMYLPTSLHPGECINLHYASQNNPSRMGWPKNSVGLVHEGEIRMNVFSPSVHHNNSQQQ